MQFQFQLGPTFRGICDASAAAPLDVNHFVAASDETSSAGQNRLLIYRYDAGVPVGILDLNAHLQTEGARPEADIESAARVGDVIFWVTSHGRNTRGKLRPNRERFFATDWHNNELRFWGNPRFDLKNALISQNEAIREAEKHELAPENGGLSIEGLCEGETGKLWIGLRSPLVGGNALAFCLDYEKNDFNSENFGLTHSWTLDLGGRGIRDWTKIGENLWLVLAGSARSADDFALYSWNGALQSAPTYLGDVDEALAAIGAAGMHPEAILARQNGEIYLMGDDGDRLCDGVLNKTLLDECRTFRSAKLTKTE